MTPTQKALAWLKQYGIPLLLIAIILLGAALRAKHMTSSFQRDEIATYMVSSQGFAAAFGHNFYPLSYVLSHFALKLGDSEALLRLPSYTAGLLGIWLMYFLGSAWHSKKAGLVAAFLLSVSSIHIYYSRDGRFYSLVTLAVIITLWAIFRALENPRQLKWWLLYTGGIILGITSHPFYLPFLWSITAGAALAAFFQRKSKPHQWRFITMLLIFTAIGLLPASIIYYEFKQARPGSITNLTIPTHRQSFRLTPARYLSFYKSCLLYQQPAASGILLLLTAGGAALLFKRRRLTALPVLAVPLLMPLPFFFITVNHDYSIRYFAPHSAVISLLIAICAIQLARYIGYWLSAPLRQRLRHLRLLQNALLIGGIAVLATTTLTKHLYDYHYTEIWKEEAQIMAPYVTKRDVIIYFSPFYYHLGKLTQEPAEDFVLSFYLHRLLIDGRRDRYPHELLYTKDVTQLDAWLKQFRDRNIWLVHSKARPVTRLSPAQRELFQTKLIGQQEIFSLAGAPATNLIADGDFQNSGSGPLKSFGNVTLTPVDPADPEAGTCLKLAPADNNEPTSAHFKIAADPASTATRAILNPASDYVLSMDIKYARVPGNAYLTSGAVLSLQGKNPDGTEVSASITDFFWWSDWKSEAFPIRRSDFPQLYEASELKLVLTHAASYGTLWIDNIQFEAGDHPTPYVNGTRLPHDQALAKIEAGLARN